MPRPSANILELAKRGAEARYHELQTEIASLVKSFPHLRIQKRTGLAGLVDRATAAVPKRRKYTMSAAQKKAVSARMRKYWAERRKQAKAAAKQG